MFFFANPAFAYSASGGAIALGKSNPFIVNSIFSIIKRIQSALFLNYSTAVALCVMVFTFGLKLVEFPFYKSMVESEMNVRDMMSKWTHEKLQYAHTIQHLVNQTNQDIYQKASLIDGTKAK